MTHIYQKTNSTQSKTSYPHVEDEGQDKKSNFIEIWESISNRFTLAFEKATDSVSSEFSVPISQKQLNEALEKFVTKNVKQILEIRTELHNDWFRLYCTIEAAGIYIEVASNFRLVHAQLDRNVQRFVFAQLTNTDILSFYCNSVFKRQGIKLAIWFYHKILKKDPLGFILSYINIAKSKDNIIYLDINRWLKKNKKIMSGLVKAQVNYAFVEEEQLIFKTNVNIKDLFASRDIAEVITPDDEPQLMDGPINPIDDATNPSFEQ